MQVKDNEMKQKDQGLVPIFKQFLCGFEKNVRFYMISIGLCLSLYLKIEINFVSLITKRMYH